MKRVFGQSKDVVHEQDGGEHWLSVSDLMAGLMMVFLFISIALMRSAFVERDKAQEVAADFQQERDKAKELAIVIQKDRDKIKKIALTYQENQGALFEALHQEFDKDLSSWDAEIDKASLSINFKAPEVLFDTGKVTLKPKFQEILDDFFPRYIGVLKRFRDSIDEVRIEGHTSSDWNSSASTDTAYFNNMELSQGRTRAVLSYVYLLPTVQGESEWVKRHVAAVGFSSARLITTNGIEDRERSRRVLFRVITNAETQIRKILDLTDVL